MIINAVHLCKYICVLHFKYRNLAGFPKTLDFVGLKSFVFDFFHDFYGKIYKL